MRPSANRLENPRHGESLLRWRNAQSRSFFAMRFSYAVWHSVMPNRLDKGDFQAYALAEVPNKYQPRVIVMKTGSGFFHLHLLVGSWVVLLAPLGSAQPGSVDTTFHAELEVGILALTLQPDGKILAAANYVNPINGAGVVRLHENGSLDESFLPALRPFTEDFGLGGTIWSLALHDNDKVLVGGRVRLAIDEDTERGAGIARLNADGSIDAGFQPSSGVGDVLAIAVQRDGKILIGGGAIDVPPNAELPVTPHVVRLNRDGSRDTGFDAGIGEDHSINAIAIQHDKRIIIGGAFRTIDGKPQAGVARLNSDGSLDTAFRPLIEGNIGTYRAGFTSLPGVFAIALEAKGTIVIAGTFARVNGTSRNGIARLHADGSLDRSFDSGSGANAPVSALQLDKQGRVLLGGDFTSVNGLLRRHVARLNHDGSVDLSFVPDLRCCWVRTMAVEGHSSVLVGGVLTSQDTSMGLLRLRLSDRRR